MKKNIIFIFLFSFLVYTVTADDLADILQDLAVQIACLGRYSVVQANKYVTSRYKDPPDYYQPPMLAERFATMSGNMTRTITFYGVCFDYAQFAWDEINKYQKTYNKAGMKSNQWYIASTNNNDPYTIILYDPVSKDKATIIMNGIYLKENSRHNIYAHDGATGHAWLWVQHNNGTWYWIDPTWTDNTGYVWWGIVKDGKETQYDPNPKYCVASNYPNYTPSTTNNNSQDSKPRNTKKLKPEKPNMAPSNNNIGDSNHFYSTLLGYNYSYGMPLGVKIGFSGIYASMNMGFIKDTDTNSNSSGFSGTLTGFEILGGFNFPLINNRLFLLIGGGVSYTSSEKEIITGSWSGPDGSGYFYGKETEWNKGKDTITFEIGLLPVVLKHFYLSATYKLIGFSKSGFSLGAGFIF